MAFFIRYNLNMCCCFGCYAVRTPLPGKELVFKAIHWISIVVTYMLRSSKSQLCMYVQSCTSVCIKFSLMPLPYPLARFLGASCLSSSVFWLIIREAHVTLSRKISIPSIETYQGCGQGTREFCCLTMHVTILLDVS